MKPEELTYRFHKFRPSDRDALRSAALGEHGEQLFQSALHIYLDKWAKADWLTDYELERIAIWTALHLPKSQVAAILAMVTREEAAAQTEQAKKTYHVFCQALRKELGTSAGGFSQAPVHRALA